jgi:hypothetical protein
VSSNRFNVKDASVIDNVTRLSRHKQSAFGNRQLILLSPNQLEAIVLQLEQATTAIRVAIEGGEENGMRVSHTKHVESIVGSTEDLLRDINRCNSNREQFTCDSTPVRIGRPRRSRRQNR